MIKHFLIPSDFRTVVKNTSNLVKMSGPGGVPQAQDELQLLERVFNRLGCAETDDQLLKIGKAPASSLPIPCPE